MQRCAIPKQHHADSTSASLRVQQPGANGPRSQQICFLSSCLNNCFSWQGSGGKRPAASVGNSSSWKKYACRCVRGSWTGRRVTDAQAVTCCQSQGTVLLGDVPAHQLMAIAARRASQRFFGRKCLWIGLRCAEVTHGFGCLGFWVSPLGLFHSTLGFHCYFEFQGALQSPWLSAPGVW